MSDDPYWKNMEERRQRQRDEAARIMTELGIERPPCGFDVGLGWMPHVEQAFKEMIDAGWDRSLSQVKQKFGGLRIYVGNIQRDCQDGIVAAIQRAEAACDVSCEFCGQPHGLTVPLSGLALCPTCKGTP